MIGRKVLSNTKCMWCYNYCLSKILEKFVGEAMIWNIQFQVDVAKNIKDFPWEVTNVELYKRLVATLDLIIHALKFYRKHLIHKIISNHLITNEIVIK